MNISIGKEYCKMEHACPDPRVNIAKVIDGNAYVTCMSYAGYARKKTNVSTGMNRKIMTYKGGQLHTLINFRAGACQSERQRQ